MVQFALDVLYLQEVRGIFMWCCKRHPGKEKHFRTDAILKIKGKESADEILSDHFFHIHGTDY